MLSKETLQQIAKKHNVSIVEVRKIYKEYWKVIREILESLDLTQEYNTQKEMPCVNIPYFGHITIPLHRYNKLKPIFLKGREDDSKES